jgi:hypothetical protein
MSTAATPHVGVPYSAARIAGTFAAHPTISQKQAAWFYRAGITERALLDPSPIRTGLVIWSAPGRFVLAQHEPAGMHAEAEQACLLLLNDENDEPADIAAWAPRSQRLGTWRGCAWAIGQETTWFERLSEPGVPVWRSPLDWLQAERNGLVLLRPKVAAEILCDAGPLLAMDVAHGVDLRSSLSRPGPRILVREQMREAA